MADLEGTAGLYVIFVIKSYCLKLAIAIMYGTFFLQFFTKSAWIADVRINPLEKKSHKWVNVGYIWWHNVVLV